jgi:hypothetical protein
MSMHRVIAAALLGWLAVSCGENNSSTASQSSQGKVSNAAPAQGPQPALSPRGAPQGVARQDDSPVPPKDAQWTIFCDKIDGPNHVAVARELKTRLVAKSQMRDWYVIHGSSDSSLYYGFYRSIDDPRDPAERKRAESDRMRIQSLTTPYGEKLVRGGILVPLDAPDPEAPPKWNLTNTPKTAYWSLQIAAFKDDPHRKEAAVQAVRELRAQGEEAYYYHGPVISSVCIGAWPREAVKEQGTGLDAKGMSRDDAHTIDPTQPLLVFTGDQAPDNVARDVREPGTGKRMAVMGMKLEVQDKVLDAKIKQFPTHSVNYEVHGTKSGEQTFADPSFLVIIPHDEAEGSPDNSLLTAGPAPRDVSPRTPASPGDEGLRSIGDR